MSEAKSKDLEGKVMIVTGANTGIGRVTAWELAQRGAKVYLASRSLDKTQPVVDNIRAHGGAAEFLQIDLGELASVRRAAESFLATGDRLDVLVNNAGLAGLRGTTKDGFEITFGTNHLGPFLFTTMLLPRLREAGAARIVNVASVAHYKAEGLDLDNVRQSTRTTTGLPEYQHSKLCNVLFTKQLAAGEAGEGVHSYSLHPGVIASDVWRNVPWPIRPLMTLFMKSNEDGARTSLHCATSAEVASHDGRYYNDDTREKKPSKYAEDPALAKLLWERSLAWTKAV
ncbi:MAG: SDR family oxidoreductase [Deltaproteobacteria bacterium]|nr:SDR family oxidoreductase [Deltaproteobacteria bacterium]